MTNELDTLRELEAAGEKATPKRLDTGPTTAAGDVWVYAGGEPLLEPTHWWGRFARLFKVRADSHPAVKRGYPSKPTKWAQELVSSVNDPKADPHWLQKRADAEFFVAAANARPDLAKLLKRHEALLAVEKAAREWKRLREHVASYDDDYDSEALPVQAILAAAKAADLLDAALAAYAVLDAGKGEG